MPSSTQMWVGVPLRLLHISMAVTTNTTTSVHHLPPPSIGRAVSSLNLSCSKMTRMTKTTISIRFFCLVVLLLISRLSKLFCSCNVFTSLSQQHRWVNTTQHMTTHTLSMHSPFAHQHITVTNLYVYTSMATMQMIPMIDNGGWILGE